MRYLFTIALSLSAAGSIAAQQGEIIIRRPGVPDRVIKLDSTAASRAEIARFENQFRELSATLQQRTRELPMKLQRDLESANVKALHEKLQATTENLRATAMEPKRIQELRNKIQADLAEPIRERTLALREAEIPSMRLFEPMMRDLEVARRSPYLGIVVKTEPAETDKYGAYIEAVTPGTPAERAGMRAGDIITRIAGKSLAAKDSREESNPGLRLIGIIATLPIGKPADVELRRGDRTVNVKVTPSDNGGAAIARMAPTLDMMRTIPDRVSGEIMARGVPAAPSGAQYNVFTNGNGAFTYSFGMNGLFANIELTSLNEKLGSYFGTNEGVLVVNVGAPRDVVFMAPTAAARTGAAGGGGRGGVAAGRMTDSTMTMGRGGAVRMDTVTITSRGGGGAGGTQRLAIRGRADSSNPTYVDGVPVARKMFTMGLEPGDVIVSVDGRKVTSPSQLLRIVGSYEHNDEFKLQIMRQKRAETLTVKMP